jgi:hypothetical protein
MSATTATARPRALTAALSAETIARAVVVLGVALLVVVTWMAWGDLAHDTGYDWVAAQRLVDHGQLPYEDFPYWYGPLGVGALSATFALFGSTVGAAAGLGLALAGLAIVLSYALARHLTGPLGAALVALLTASATFATGNMSFVLPHAQVAPIAVVLCLAALLAAARGRLALAGLAVGLVALTRPEFLGAIAAALGLWLALRVARAPRGERRRPVLDAILVVALAVAVPVVGYGVMLVAASPHDLRESLFPSAVLAAGGNHVLRGSAPLTAASFAELIGRLAVYGAGCAALVGLGALARRGGRARQLVLLAATGAGLAFLAALAANPEAIRSRLDLAFAWIPAGAAVAALLLAWRARPRARGSWSARDQVALLLCAFLAVLAAKTYAAFVPAPNAQTSQFAIYAMPFAALFLTWLHGEALPRCSRALGLGWVAALCVACVALTAVDGRHETATVRGARGALALPAAQAPAFQGAVAAIERDTRPGEPVLAAPQLSGLLGLTGRQQATVPVSLVPGALASADDERRAIRRMSAVRLAIVDRRALTEYGQGPFGVTFDRELAAWLRRDFRLERTLRGSGPDPVVLAVWKRRST